MGKRRRLTLVVLLIITTSIYSQEDNPISYYPKKKNPFQVNHPNRKIRKTIKIAIGSPKEDVLSTLGPPHSIDKRSKNEIWHYPQGYLFFSHGKVVKKQLPTIAKHTKPLPSQRKQKFVPAKKETHRTAGFLRPASLRYTRTYSKKI